MPDSVYVRVPLRASTPIGANNLIAHKPMPRRDPNQLPLFDSQVRFGPERPVLAYVIQKHHATRLHFDLRLEIGGVMKSWAVPKGPSTNSGSRRLAVQVHDHPKDYNAFEGVIPRGNRGAGPVMLWDYGTFAPTAEGAFDVEQLRDDYEAGEFSFVLFGTRLGGRWTLTRRSGPRRDRSEWDLQKGPDEFSDPPVEPVDEFRTSVVTGRTMAEIELDAD